MEHYTVTEKKGWPWCGLVGWASSRAPGLQARSPVGGTLEAANQCFALSKEET